MKTNKKIILALSITLVSLGLSAQEDLASKRETMEKLRQEFIMERMDLTEEESRKVKAIEKDHREELRSRITGEGRKGRTMRLEMKEEGIKTETISEEEAKRILTERLTREEVRLVLNKKYTQRMIEEISAKKTLEYKHLEREFKKELLRMLKDDEKDHHLREEFIKLKIEEEKELEE